MARRQQRRRPVSAPSNDIKADHDAPKQAITQDKATDATTTKDDQQTRKKVPDAYDIWMQEAERREFSPVPSRLRRQERKRSAPARLPADDADVIATHRGLIAATECHRPPAAPIRFVQASSSSSAPSTSTRYDIDQLLQAFDDEDDVARSFLSADDHPT